MILYHGTNLEIQKPNIDYAKSYLDFGKGFYLTTYKEQAEKWALRKALRKGREAVDIYYKSRLCEQIHAGNYGIQYMDYKYLVEDLLENELVND